jgi:hypothetical protein
MAKRPSAGLRIGAGVAVGLALAMLVVVLALSAVWRRCVRCCATAGDCAAGQRCTASVCAAGSAGTPAQMFTDTSDPGGAGGPGGLLAHMWAPEDVTAVLATQPFTFGLTSQGIADCAAINRKTCSAWTYLRSDLPPTLFIYPSSPTGAAGYWTPVCGLILDPRIAWPLVTSMSVVDSDTNARSCCGNESGSAAILRTSDAPGGLPCTLPKGKWALYLASDAVGSCPTSCPAGDASCRAVNAGGGINVWDLVSWPQPCDCIDWANPVTPSASDLKQLEGGGTSYAGYTFYTLKSCPLCAGPYICSTTPLADNADYASTPGGARAYVGQSGERFGPLFYSSDWANFSIGSLAIRQCKFARDTWSQWVSALKLFYAQVAGSFADGNTLPGALSYMQGSPCLASYTENEVNLYVDPAAPDDATFRAAIVGFFWVSSTCTEQLAPLEGVVSVSPQGGCTYDDVAKRCNDFLCPVGTECPNASTAAAAQRRDGPRHDSRHGGRVQRDVPQGRDARAGLQRDPVEQRLLRPRDAQQGGGRPGGIQRRLHPRHRGAVGRQPFFGRRRSTNGQPRGQGAGGQGAGVPSTGRSAPVLVQPRRRL